ncbi:MaoC family dehydratase [Nocardia neocaledoniensis]|uniref:MaoC family dehydratase n=1 Tax=Nocardia neocaledoniensis TaxID=236511 RepID=UPI00245719E5|nr:MaoC family dehydratase [Nocardia neocaledoniensis]
MKAEGPYFDELERGQVFGGAPAVTLSEGAAAVHQSIVGDRLRLPLDRTLSRSVTGESRLAHPALVWDIAIGQSTVVTHHVRANLFYRGLVFGRMPSLGDTLLTTTTVEGLRENTRRPDRAPTGLVALRIRTIDQDSRVVLDFWRCAMLPLRGDAPTSHRDDLDDIGAGPNRDWVAAVRDWKLDALKSIPDGGAVLPVGQTVEVAGGDLVDGAAQLARLSLNIAQVHHDVSAAGGRRLVYGGHTIGLALSQASRAFPNLVTVVGWHGCDHVGPVHEGDTVRSKITVERVTPLTGGASLVELRSMVFADGADGPDAAYSRQVLDWRYVAVFA